MGGCETSEEERDVLEKMRKIDEGGMEKFGTLDSSEKTTAILGDRWWPQKAKQEGDKISKKFTCNMVWEKRNERPNVGGVSIRSRNGAPSRKGCVVNGQTAKASNKRVPLPLPGFWESSALKKTGIAGACAILRVVRYPSQMNTAVGAVVQL